MHLQTFPVFHPPSWGAGPALSSPDPGTDPQSCIQSQGSATGRGEDDTAGRTLSPSFFSCPPFPSLVPHLLWSLCIPVRHQPRDVLSLARAESVLVLASPLQGHKASPQPLPAPVPLTARSGSLSQDSCELCRKYPVENQIRCQRAEGFELWQVPRSGEEKSVMKTLIRRQ